MHYRLILPVFLAALAILMVFLASADDSGTVVSEGFLSIESDPAGAIVWVDGQFAGSTPLTREVSAGGNHLVLIEQAGYQSWSAIHSADQGETIHISALLTAMASKRGYLSCSSSPSGASVYIDGSYRGNTPLTVGNLNIGSHMIELRMAGYEKLQSEFQVKASETTSLHLDLKPYTRDTGAIRIWSTPSGASVYVNGNYQGTTLGGGYVDSIDIPDGQHSIMLRKSGYNDYATDIIVSRGTIQYLLAIMDKPAASPWMDSTSSPLSWLEIISDPLGAEVYINDQFYGYSPFSLHDVAPGTHTLTLKMQGYSDWTSTVRVDSRGGTIVTAIFSPLPALPEWQILSATIITLVLAVMLLPLLLDVIQRGEVLNFFSATFITILSYGLCFLYATMGLWLYVLAQGIWSTIWLLLAYYSIKNIRDIHSPDETLSFVARDYFDAWILGTRYIIKRFFLRLMNKET